MKPGVANTIGQASVGSVEHPPAAPGNLRVFGQTEMLADITGGRGVPDMAEVMRLINMPEPRPGVPQRLAAAFRNLSTFLAQLVGRGDEVPPTLAYADYESLTAASGARLFYKVRSSDHVTFAGDLYDISFFLNTLFHDWKAWSPGSIVARLRGDDHAPAGRFGAGGVSVLSLGHSTQANMFEVGVNFGILNINPSLDAFRKTRVRLLEERVARYTVLNSLHTLLEKAASYRGVQTVKSFLNPPRILLERIGRRGDVVQIGNLNVGVMLGNKGVVDAIVFRIQEGRSAIAAGNRSAAAVENETLMTGRPIRRERRRLVLWNVSQTNPDDFYHGGDVKGERHLLLADVFDPCVIHVFNAPMMPGIGIHAASAGLFTQILPPLVGGS